MIDNTEENNKAIEEF